MDLLTELRDALLQDADLVEKRFASAPIQAYLPGHQRVYHRIGSTPRCQYWIERYLVQIVPLCDQTAFQSLQRIVLTFKDLGGCLQLGIVQLDQHLIRLDPIALLDQQGLDGTTFAVLHG